MQYKVRLSPKFLTMALAVVMIAAGSSIAAPAPIAMSGNPSCATLNASSNPAFAHMTTDWEFKLDPPSAGTHALTSVSGGMPPSANLFINTAFTNGNTMSAWSMSWSAPQFVDRLVSAVIVKGGPNGANVYPYNPLDSGDTGPFTVPGEVYGISHLSFCFEPFSAPSAADAAVSGRVLSATGRPISGAVVTLINLNTGKTERVVTNSFGVYIFSGLPVNNFYTMNVQAVRQTFYDPARTFELADNLTDYDFVAVR